MPGRAILGTNVCRVHGALAPKVLAKARERVAAYVAALVDPDRILYETAQTAYADPRMLFD